MIGGGGGQTEAAAADNGDNTYISDVIGNKNDAITTNTIMGQINFLNKLFTTEVLTYDYSVEDPLDDLGDPIDASSTPWAWGDYKEMVAASTLSNDFIIKSVEVRLIELTNYYGDLEIAYGAGDTEVCTIPIRAAGIYPVWGATIPGDSRIRVRFRSLGQRYVRILNFNYIEV